MELTNKLHVVISAVHNIVEGVEAWRVLADIVSDFPSPNKLVKTYYVWVTGEYLEDSEGLSADEKGASKFALRWVKQRFIASNNETPQENGVSCYRSKCKLIEDPINYIHPAEKSRFS